MDKTQTTRDVGLDVMRIFCAFLVVCIHTWLPWGLQGTITRQAVPCFFMLSGYFLFYDDCQKRIIKSIKKVCAIFLISCIIYIAYRLLLNHFTAHTYDIEIIRNCAINIILANDTSSIAYHLWYFPALIYALVFTYIISKTGMWKTAWILSAILWFAGLTLGQYSQLLFNTSFDARLTRNFIFVGIPMLMAGTLMRKYDNKISEYTKNNYVNAGLIILFSMTSVIEKQLINSDGLNSGDNYLSTLPLALATFYFFKNLETNKLTNTLSMMGRQHSLNIYIIHVGFVFLIEATVKTEPLYYFSNPVTAFTVSLILSVIIRHTRNKLLQRA